MNTTFRFGFIFKQLNKGLRSATLTFSMGFCLMFLSQQVVAQCWTVEKQLIAVAPPTSGISGHFDAIFRLQVNSCGPILNINVSDQLNAAGNLGTAFVGVVGLPSIVYLSPGATGGIINNAFDGAGDPDISDGAAMTGGNDTIIYQIRVEVNPTAAGAPAVLGNSFSATSFAPAGSIVSNVVTIPDCWSDCQMACNNQVQVSVNSICEAEILADMILEGESRACADLGFYAVTLYDGNKVVNMPLDKSYINKKLRVNVRNIVCNNNCWGYLVLEDKTPPVLNCRLRDTISCAANVTPAALGFPVPTINVNQNVYPYVVTGLDACGIVYLTFKDSVVRYDCSNNALSATIYRKWCASDPGGYQACCYDTIDLRRGTLADITLPPHYDGQPGNNPYLLCSGSFGKLPNGFPDTTAAGTGKPNGIYCGNIQYDFTDDTIQVCKGTYKLLRRWLILDWCNPAFRIDYIQQIKVVDDRPPIVTCPKNYTVNTNPWNCTGTLILPVPQNLTPQTIVDDKTPYVIENCSDWTYSVTHLPSIHPDSCRPVPGVGTTDKIFRMADGRYQVNNMPIGCNWIYYTITDGCGNSTVCQFDIEVKDLTPPVAVCHEKTVIGLGSTGRATVPADVFDDHSHDNCNDVTFQVRRMNPGACGTTTFRATQEFCCADVNAQNGVTVVLRVTDKAGNTSECMVQAIIQDKLPPDVTCPTNVTVNCGTDLTNLNVFGTATATDNCNVRIETRVYNYLNSCNLGTIVREFIAIDNGGLRDSCQQVITVIDPTPFKREDIVWPRDTTLTGCSDQIDPSLTGRPTYKNKDACNQPISTHEDLVFNYVEGVCFKILRKWTVIDWCTYDPANAKGIWYFTQVIKVNNTEAPTFTSSCANQVFCITEGCSLNTTLEASATDLCTPQADLRWSYKLDLNNNGSVDLSGTRNRFNTTLQGGVNRITWTVEDQCGNTNSCSYLITVNDCKRPTPFCKTGIVTVLMQNTGNVTIWAKDFVQYGEDNCTPANQLKYSFTVNVRDSSKLFTCADIPNGISDTIDVEIYITDNAGNQDVCRTKLILQDNSNACPDVPTFGNITGFIKGYNDNPSPEVTVYVADINGIMRQSISEKNGDYVFNDLAMYKDYSVQASYDQDPLNGITTKDIVKIQRHILGLELMDSPYKLIAADVNRSGTITARDISELRKMILGMQNQFDNNKSWNFVDANVPLGFDNYMNYQSSITVNNMEHTMSGLNFIAIKTGDVTGEANTGFSGLVIRNKAMLPLILDGKTFLAGEEFSLPVRSNELTDLYGLQLALKITTDQLEWVGVTSAKCKVSKDQYLIDRKTLRLSWNDDQKVSLVEGDVLFEMVFRAKSAGTLKSSDLVMSSKDMAPESYHKNSDREIQLIVREHQNEIVSKGYALYQNIPNPFTDETTIYFSSSEPGEATISIHDLSGNLVSQRRLNAVPGLNKVIITADQLNATGVLYYRLELNGFNSMQKMVILK